MLTRIINKTPLYNEKSKVYEINEFSSNMIQRIIQSRFIGEGVYGIEQFSTPNYRETYLFSPPFDDQGEDIRKEWYFENEDLNEIAVFDLRLEKPMFMPLNTNKCVDLINTIANMSLGIVFSQVLLCKRIDNWRDKAINQYETFLKGNDNPLESKIAIKIQEKVLTVLNKVSNFSVRRERIEEMEQKILQNNYRFECRFILFEQKHVNSFVTELNKILQKLQLFNELTLKKVPNKKNSLKMMVNREFQSESVNQLLSEQEVYSLLSNEKPVLARVELEKPIKNQSTLKNLEESMVLQRALQLMPLGEKRKTEIDEAKAQMVNQAFKRVGIIKNPMKVTEMYQGSSLLKVQMEMPHDLNYSKIKLVDIQAALGNQNLSIEIGDKPDTINVFLPLENREVLYFRNVLETKEFQEFKQKHDLPFIIGENVNGGYMFGSLVELKHILIAGTTGSGKSVFMTLIILSLLLNVPPDQLVVILIDPKMVEFSRFEGFPQVSEIITDMKEANAALYSLTVEMDQRYEIFSKVGVNDIQGYNEISPEKMKYIICAVDEFADLMMVNKAVEDHVVRLGQKARGAGIHLILATQRPSVDVVTGLIKANMPSRFAFSVTSAVDSKTILDKGGAEKLLGKGDGTAKIEGNRMELERFQSPVLTLDKKQEKQIFEGLKSLFDGIELIGYSLPEVKAEEPIEQLKRIIATTGELRVNELGKLMGIATAKLKALLEELVDEGWLLHEGKGRPYELNVDEDELNRWRDE